MANATMPAWPLPEEWPAPDAPVLTWARFSRERLGLEIRPTPAEVDRIAHARYLHDDALRDYRDQHKTEPPADLSTLMYDDARELAEDVRGPIPQIASWYRARRATDEDLVRWFTPAIGPQSKRTQHHLERGLCCVLDDACPFVQVDVDPRHGGDLAGQYATLAGCKVATPRGGVHVFMLRAAAIPGEGPVRPSSGKHALAPGVEVRVTGFALLPSGASTPDRRWVCTDAPVPAPLALRRTGNPTRVWSAPESTGPASPWEEDGAPLGHVAYLISTDAEEGTRNTSGSQIVGLLARPRAVPEDVLRALLVLLAEHGAGMDWPAARLAEEGARWQALLTRGPRDAEFAAEVLATWIGVRDTTSRPWKAGKARALARSVWKTADRREEGLAGAEDMGHAGEVGEWDGGPPESMPGPAVAAPPPPPAPPIPPAMPQETGGDAASEAFVADVLAPTPITEAMGIPEPTPADRLDAEKAARLDAFVRSILPTLGEAYPMESRRAAFKRRSIPVGCLYPFLDFKTGRVEGEAQDPDGVGHGLGDPLSRAVGGLRQSGAVCIGGAGAKLGKSHFVGQAVEGVALATAARYLKIPGYEDAPIVLPVWITEMPREGEVCSRMTSRHLGFDMAALEEEWGEQAPGVARMAGEFSTTSARVVERAWQLSEHCWKKTDPLGWAIEHLIREVDLSKFPAPKGQGRGRVDQSTGPNLVGWIALAVRMYRLELARMFGVDEDEVLPWIILDPGQRFTGEDESSKAALDALLGAVVNKLCRSKSRGGLGACVWMTSDTTKAAARDIDLQRFLSEQGQRLAADIFAGSQGVMHHFDVVALCGEDNPADPLMRTQWVRVLQSRTGAPQVAFPFGWEAHKGRFRARPPEPLPAPDPDADPRKGGGGKRGHTSTGAGGPKVGEYTPTPPPSGSPPRPGSYRPNGVRFNPGESPH